MACAARRHHRYCHVTLFRYGTKLYTDLELHAYDVMDSKS
jgi:hypothetical protein